MTRNAPTDVDLRYGLEPVLEPGSGAGSSELERFVELTCPYCGEAYGVAVDLSAGTQTYIEDCQVCCQPISNTIIVDEGGEFASLQTERLDR
jgi:hypothetical protein